MLEVAGVTAMPLGGWVLEHNVVLGIRRHCTPGIDFPLNKYLLSSLFYVYYVIKKTRGFTAPTDKICIELIYESVTK